MTIFAYYTSPVTPGAAAFSVDVSGAIRLASITGLVIEAEAGAVGSGNVVLDDPTSSVGHASDGVVGLKQFYITETDCPAGNRRLFTGYIGDRKYYRGKTDSLITGTARVIDATLYDVNCFLSFRVFAPVANDAADSFVRPAETDLQRVQALLNVGFLAHSLYDIGYIPTTGGVAMDANDYTGSHPGDVLNSCAQASGRNYFVLYDEASGHLVLWYDKWTSDGTTTLVYDSPLSLTNVLSEASANVVTSGNVAISLTAYPGDTRVSLTWSTSSYSPYYTAVRATNPISYWRLDETSGTVAADVMGANPGTYVNAPTLGVAGLLTGDSDTAVTLSAAVPQYVSAAGPNIAGASTPFSLAVWCNPTLDGNPRIVLSITDGTDAGAFLRVANYETVLGRKGSTLYFSSGPSLSAGRHLLAGTFDGTVARLFVDGIQTGIDDTASVTLPTTSLARVGITGVGWVNPFNGTIDEPAIWNRALSPTEVAGLYAAGTTAPTPPTTTTPTYVIEPDAVETIDPSRVVSAVYLPYTGGTAYQTLPTTANTFAWRDVVAPSVTVKVLGTAKALANRYLVDNATEDNRITLTVQLPSSAVTLLREGMRVQLHATHLPNVSAGFTWCRVLSRTIRQDQETSSYYWIDLDLSVPPQLCANPTPAGTYPPNLSGTSVAPGYIFYLKPGLTYPTAPTPSFAGGWNFPTYNSGGVDLAGDCVENQVRVIVIGNGTVTIPTLYGGGTTGHTWIATLNHIDPVSHVAVVDQTLTGNVGDSVAFTVSPVAWCTSWVDITEWAGHEPTCGSVWAGFQGFTWVAA